MLKGAAQAQTTQKKELVTAQAGDIAKFDPHFSTASQDIRISFNLFDNLTSRHPDGKLYPGLATDWQLEGQTTWRFKLRQGVKFHNGDPFTSADAKFSLERTYDPNAKTMVATVFTTIDRIEAPDPSTLVILTKKPDPLLPARLAFYGGQIVPKKYLESVGSDTFNAKPVGTGPISFNSWVKDDKAVFDAYAGYWGGKIDVDHWIIRAIPETAPRIAALLKGEVDIITQLPPDQEERIKANASTRVVRGRWRPHALRAQHCRLHRHGRPRLRSMRTPPKRRTPSRAATRGPRRADPLPALQGAGEGRSRLEGERDVRPRAR